MVRLVDTEVLLQHSMKLNIVVEHQTLGSALDSVYQSKLTDEGMGIELNTYDEYFHFIMLTMLLVSLTAHQDLRSNAHRIALRFTC